MDWGENKLKETRKVARKIDSREMMLVYRVCDSPTLKEKEKGNEKNYFRLNASLTCRASNALDKIHTEQGGSNFEI
jgi:hypothetical protein